MATYCQPKPISMDFGSLEGEGVFMCGRNGAVLDWSEVKDKFSSNNLLIFVAIKI